MMIFVVNWMWIRNSVCKRLIHWWIMFITSHRNWSVDCVYNITSNWLMELTKLPMLWQGTDVTDLFLTCVESGADDSSSNLWAIGIKITAIKKIKFRLSSKKIFFTYLYSRLNLFYGLLKLSELINNYTKKLRSYNMIAQNTRR